MGTNWAVSAGKVAKGRCARGLTLMATVALSRSR